MFSIITNIKMLNDECENALIDFPFHDNTYTWISNHEILFNKCESNAENIKKESTPIEHNLFIQKFLALYLMHNKK
jgi:hypothetical protein